MIIGTGETLMTVIILLIVFSASRMGTLGNALGKFVYSFRKASRGDDLVDVKRAGRLERGSSDAELNEPPKP